MLQVSKDLRVVDKESRDLPQISAHPGWNEHDPDVIYNNVVECLNEVCSRNKLNAKNVEAIGITNQRETVVAFDKRNGRPLYNAIVWNDKRTA